MGLSDRLKEFQAKAAEAVAENQAKITDAVGEIADAANVQTRGKYAEKIAKAETQAKHAVEKLAERAPHDDPEAEPPAGA